MKAVAELERFSADPEMRELERRRKLWKLEYFSGLAAAKKEGREEGRNTGRAEEKAESVILLLKSRFDDVPAYIEAALNRITNPDVLNSLNIEAARCVSIGEFAGHLP